MIEAKVFLQKNFSLVHKGEHLCSPLQKYSLFHNKPNQLDADNLSKPIWDA